MDIGKINRNAINAYKSVASVKTAEKKGGGAKPANVDTVDFNFAGSVNAAKFSTANRIDAEANAARIRELQKAYAGDNCPVGAEEVAAAIAGLNNG